MNQPVPATTPTSVPPLPPSTLGFKTLLEGPGGTGKTYSIGTLIDSGLEVFYLGIGEAGGMEALLGYYLDRGLPLPPNFHHSRVEFPSVGFDEMLKTAKLINSLTYDALTKMTDSDRSKHNQFIQPFSALNNFTDQNGKSFGPVDKWGPDKALVVDSLTGIGAAAMSLVVGGKPVKSQPDWQIAMDQVEKLLKKLTDGCKCHFILISHIDRETDEVTGGTKIMTGTLGRKLAPKLPPMFSDVIMSVRTGTQFSWSTASAQADLKARNLPIADGLKPDFQQIVSKWKSRLGIQ